MNLLLHVWPAQHPVVYALGPLILSLLATAAAFAAYLQMRAFDANAAACANLHERIDAQVHRLHALPARPLPARPLPGTKQETTPREALPPETSQRDVPPASPLEPRLLALRNFVRPLLVQLGHWETASGLRLDDLTDLRARLHTLDEALASAPSLVIAGSAEDEVNAILPTLLPLLVSRSDRDLDPARANPPLQQSLAQVFANTGFSLIDPGQGAPFDPASHTSLGIFQRGTPGQRGTVGQVRCRGVQRHSGEVLLKAEVLEFD